MQQMIMLKDGLIPTRIEEEKAFWHCDVTPMTSQSHVTSSVMTPFDCRWTLPLDTFL